MTRGLAVLLILMAGCSPAESPTNEEWSRVVQMEKVWKAAPPEARLEARQAWLDQLRTFVEQHPGHREAAARYDDEEADFGIQLAANGRYQEAVRHFESVLLRNPAHEAARMGLDTSRPFANRTAEMFGSLVRGDSEEAVSEKIGLPRNGWTRAQGSTEVWYYELADGRTAEVRFADGSFQGFAIPVESESPNP